MLSRLKRDLTMADAARAPGGARVDLLLVADMVAPGAQGARRRLRRRRAAAAARRDSAASTAAASSCRARASTNASPRALRSSRATPTPTSPTIPNDAFDYVILSQTLAGDAPSARRCWSTCCASAGTPSCRSRISATGASALQVAVRRPHAAHRQPAVHLVRHAEHPFLHHQGLPRSLRRDRRQDGTRAWR